MFLYSDRKSGSIRLYAFLMILCLLFLRSAICFADDDTPNLIENGSFESVETDGIPAGWYTDAYVRDEGHTIFRSDDEYARTGSRSVFIQNFDGNDARYVQVIPVEPETMYCLSGYVRTADVKEGHGANLSIEGLYLFSNEIHETEEDWTRLELYGETGEDQTEVTIYVRLGGYSGESKGKAWFDDITLEEVDDLPEGMVASMWCTSTSQQQADEDQDSADEDETASYLPKLLLMSAFWTIVMLALLHLLQKEKYTLVNGKRLNRVILVAGVLLALALRLILAAKVTGYPVDVSCFNSWGWTMRKVGPAEFYTTTSFCDYPPAYIYLLGLNAAVCDLFGFAYGSAGCRMVFRLVPSLCEIAAALLIRNAWITAHETEKGKDPSDEMEGTLLAVAVLFCPALILNTAAWGQIDSVLCLLLLAVVLLALKDKWIFALPLYMLAALTKPQALIFGVLGLFFMIREWLQKKEQRTGMIQGLLLAFVTALAVILPFGIGKPFGWLIELYSATLSSYAYATVNAANYYYLFGGNWNAINNVASTASALILAALCAGYGVICVLNNASAENRTWRSFLPEVLLMATFAVFFTLTAICHWSWSVMGYGAMALAFAVVLPMCARGKKTAYLPLLGALLLMLIYTFGIKMHERYLFPAFLLLLLAYIRHRDFRLLLLFILWSVVIFLNEGIILDNAIRLGSENGHLLNDTKGLNMVLSALACVCTLLCVWTAQEIVVRQKIRARFSLPFALPCRKKAEGKAAAHAYCSDPGLHWKRKDSLLLIAITAVYAAIGVFNLGSTKAPQNPWISSSPEEQVILDLGENKKDFHMLYFAQVSYHDFSVAVSEDGENWSEEYPAEMAQGQCWKWKYLTHSYAYTDGTHAYYSGYNNVESLSGRYVRLTSCQIGLKLCEVLFRTADGRILPATVKERLNGAPDNPLYSDPARLVDEQDTFEMQTNFFARNVDASWQVPQPSWYNSTYFDEIYHARTGYEMLHGQSPYETSHPPLGKLMMSASIAVFGMTPFGWRFAGYLIGVLMIPAIYLLTRQLTKKTWPSLIAAVLMALDTMHLTQTRIATVDSYPVFFILMAFFFMVRFFQRDLPGATMRQILPDLCLSGFMMGCAIASKWIGCYAAVGLAILFFWKCGRTLAEAGESKDRKHTASVRNRILCICLWCVLFFVLVPAIIYLLCYVPYFMYDRSHIQSFGAFVKRVLQTQKGMLNYHATPGLGMDHPFYSPWYEWPVSGKPMYYASDDWLPDATLSYSIFCFGNPAIWLPAIAALAVLLVFILSGHRYRLADSDSLWHIARHDGDFTPAIVVIALLCQYIPWILVPRGTYIYHYFASTPFLYLMLALCISRLTDRNKKAGKIVGLVYIALCAAAFVFYFPYASGMLTPGTWLDVIKDFPNTAMRLKIYH